MTFKKLKRRIKKVSQNVKKPVKKVLKKTERVVKKPLKVAVKINKELIFKPTKKILKETKRGLKKTEKVLRKPVKKGLKSLEKTVKEAAIPIAITIATGGTGIPTILATTAITRATTKKIKNPYVKAAISTAISGSITNSGKILQDTAKSVVAVKVARKTKSSAAAALVVAAVGGDIKNVHDAGKIITREVVKEQVSKKVLKKTKNVLLSQVAGSLSGLGAENIYGKVRVNYEINKLEKLKEIEQKRIKNELEQKSSNKDTIKDKTICEKDRIVTKEKPKQEIKDTIKDKTICEKDRIVTKEKPKQEIKEKILNKKVNTYQDVDTELKLNLDNGKANISASKSYGNESVNGTVTISNDSLGVSSSMKVNDRTSVGNHVNVTKNSLSGGISVKNNNVENSYSVAVRKDGFWNSEVGIEHSQTISRKTDIKGVCVSKTTYKQDIRVPLCGKVGTVEQNVTTCPGKITVTNYKGFNTKGGICGGAVATATVVGAPIVIAAAGETAVVASGAIIAGTTVPVLVTAN